MLLFCFSEVVEVEVEVEVVVVSQARLTTKIQNKTIEVLISIFCSFLKCAGLFTGLIK